MMKGIIAVNIFMIFLIQNIYGQDEICEYQEDKIRVTAQQISKDPDSYVFLVTNLTDGPLWSFSIGSSKEIMLWPIADNKLQNITGPKGWKAFDRFGEDGTLRYLWSTQDKELAISPQSSNSEFRISLKNIAPSRPKQYIDNGIEVEQTKIKGLEYRVFIRGHSKSDCGLIDVVDYIQEEED